MPVHVAIDLAITTLAYLTSYTIRGALAPQLGDLHRIEERWWVPLIGAGLWLPTLQVLGMYAGAARHRPVDVLRKVAVAALLVAILLGFALFIVKAQSFSRPVFALYIILGATGLALERLIFRALVTRHEPAARPRTIVIGTGSLARQVAVGIEREGERGGRELVGFVACGEGSAVLDQTRVLGSLTDLPLILDRDVIDEVVIALPPQDLSLVGPAIAACDEVGVNASLLVPFLAPPARFEITTVGNALVLRYQRRPHSPLEASIKRICDAVIASLLLALLAPVLLLLGALIRLTSLGPALFVQRRVGFSGREFNLYKFRTMEAHAEEKRVALEPLNDRDPPVFKIRNDPRVTRLGRWLRRWSIDELPQLVNVLRGDMSLVGPRPPIPSEVARYERWQRRRLSVRPGLTGLWQVSGRSDLTFTESLQLDLAYIDEWSLWLDLQIAWRTIGAVLRHRGSY